MAEKLFCPFNPFNECPECPGSAEINAELASIFGEDWAERVHIGRGVSPEAVEIQDRAREAVGMIGLLCEK